MMEGDGRPPRRQTYGLGDKRAYAAPGERFEANVTILAGVPESLADVNRHLADRYDPLGDIAARHPMDRYAAVKALRFRADLRQAAVPAIENTLDTEPEIRVALEAAGAAAALGSNAGEDRIASVLRADGGDSEMSMEAILILTELKTVFAREQLRHVAMNAELRGEERRQAAIWGLGKVGLKSYGDLLPFIGDDDENAAYHAIAAFGPDTPKPVIEALTDILMHGNARDAAAASEALRVIGGMTALESLIAAANAGGQRGNLALATIGRLSPDMVRAGLAGTPLLERVEPMLLVARGASWLTSEEASADIAFLLKQAL